MNVSEHYFADVLLFFDGKPLELALYQALFRELRALSGSRNPRSVFMAVICTARRHCPSGGGKTGRSIAW